MNQNQQDSWRKVRAKGRGHYIVRGILMSVLGVVIGLILWRLGWILIAGQPYSFLLENIGRAVLIVLVFGIFGFIEANREWRSKEREYLSTQFEDSGGSRKE